MNWRVGGAIAAVVVLVLLLVTGLGWFGSGSSVSGGTRPFAVGTTLTPTSVFFGDPVVAEVAVNVDKRKFSPDSVSVAPGFTPYSETRPPVVHRSIAGHEETIRYLYTLQCVAEGCLPTKPTPKVVQFPPVLVTATSTSGATAVKVSAPWPPLPVSSRLSAHDLAVSSPKFRRASSPPAPRFGVSPVVADLLTVAGVLLGAAAIVLIGLEAIALLKRRRRRALAQRTELELALAYAREAAERPDPADRRKALGQLSRVLAHTGDEALADETGDVAWAEEAPSRERTLELADEVRPPDPAESA
jgi:hypothetical protein